jgi:hypothetical protein
MQMAPVRHSKNLRHVLRNGGAHEFHDGGRKIKTNMKTHCKLRYLTVIMQNYNIE